MFVLFSISMNGNSRKSDGGKNAINNDIILDNNERDRFRSCEGDK